eukprot:Em0001g3022a
MGDEGIADLMKVLIEDRKSRDAQFEEERKRQLTSGGVGEGSDARANGDAAEVGRGFATHGGNKDSCWTSGEERWAVKLAPYMTGKAQLAYAAMRAEDTGSYRCLKDAILRRYISEETYRRRFREAVKKEEETETMVHRNLVSEAQILDGESAVVRCAHGDSVLYPMAEVNIEVDGCTISAVEQCLTHSQWLSTRDGCSKTREITKQSIGRVPRTIECSGGYYPSQGQAKGGGRKRESAEAAAVKSATESSFACRRYSAGSVEYGRGARRIDIHWRKREAAIKYPEAVPMRVVDAESVAEELVKMFARVGIPGEILTDQGSNFTSQLLTEIYRLLHIRPIRTTPCAGPLDVLRESWVARERNTESVVSHVLAIRERMEQMSSLVGESQKACTAVSTSYWSESGTDVDEDDEIPVWKEESAGVVHYGPQLTEQQRKDLDSLMSEFALVLANTPGRTQFAEHCIETGSARPVRLPAYRIPHAYREAVRQEIEEMLEEGIVEHSNSEWSSPIVLVGKKDGSLRLCVDYRRLNSLSEADAYPMPRIDEMLDQLGTARFISTLDLTRGYWQRLMDRVIREHLVHIREVLSRLQGAGLTAKPSKCHFGMLECTYLGHVVGKGVVQPEPSKVQAVMNFPIPSTKTQTDAVLSQKNEAGDDNPIAYFSKKLQPREERYSTIEKECLAIKLAMQAFRTYLIGRHFTVETDHRSLVWMDKLKDSIPG